MSLSWCLGGLVGVVAIRSSGGLRAVGRQFVVGLSARAGIARGLERPGSRWVAPDEEKRDARSDPAAGIGWRACPRQWRRRRWWRRSR